jgi:hypothetical protein
MHHTIRRAVSLTIESPPPGFRDVMNSARGRVQDALEQGPEDRGVHLSPIEEPREMGPDRDPVHGPDDQPGAAAQVSVIVQELIERLVEIGSRFLGFPGKEPAPRRHHRIGGLLQLA